MKLEEVFKTKDVKTESTGSLTHGTREFDPFDNRGDIKFGPSSTGDGSPSSGT
jgi:hypothetical protein